MFDSIEAIEALFADAEESVSLDFKSGRSLDRMDSYARRELVKDVTAFANAGGGTLIYGVAERDENGRSVADHFDPVTNERITRDQLTQIVTSGTDPAFETIHIDALDHAGGRIFLIHVEQGDAAYQNRLDQKYYQLAGATAPARNFSVGDTTYRAISHRRSCVHTTRWTPVQPR